MATPKPLPEQVSIETRGPLDSDVRVPGSKSGSNRALLAAGLAGGASRLTGVLQSDDLDVMARALGALGVEITVEEGQTWIVRGVAGQPAVPPATLDVGASGTAARLLTAVAGALVPGPARIDGIARMRQRPIAELAQAMKPLGSQLRVEGHAGCFPVFSPQGRLVGGTTTIDARRSSQFVSALLLVAPYAQRDVIVRLQDGLLASRPYVQLTLDIMQHFGARAHWRDNRSLEVKAGEVYRAAPYRVEPDASTAAYFFAAAAVLGGRVRVLGLSGSSGQADMGVLDVLATMGCKVIRAADQVEVWGPSDGLRPVDVDMNRCPDGVLAVAVTAAFARGPSTIRNVANLRIKESDRLAALERELNRLGAHASSTADSLTISPGELRGVRIDTYHDHRMAMAFSIAGLRVPGVIIHNPACVSKSWPEFFDALERL
ncbi:MAG: 3-phosphoshikimate 1-carboxyvinyltransferase [Proteobacteria bacterium]|nr:3-phosphoshikimate 1-carboxyvinyltransferase [Pseudomonadota bacterium]